MAGDQRDDSILDTPSQTGQPTLSRAEQLEAAAQRADKTNRAHRLEAMDNRWMIACPEFFDDGRTGYYGSNRNGAGLTDKRGNAFRYTTADEAAAVVVSLIRPFEDFEPMELAPKPRFKGP